MWAQKRWAYNYQLIARDRYFWVTMVMAFLGTIVAAEALWRLAWRRASMWLRPRARPEDEIEFRLSWRRCVDAKDGEELVLAVKPGFFGTPWVPRYEEEWW